MLNKLGGFRLKYRITAGEGARDPQGLEARVIYVELGGPDVPLVTQHNGELLRALESIAAQMLRLDQREHDLISFDAGNFKALRAEELRMAAETAAEKVRRSGVPYAFPPMNSRERRLLHLAFRSLEGVETASSGEGQDRFLAVYPAGKTHLPVAAPVRPRGYGRR
jgi:spoIIIJ-associated protein